MHFKYKYTNISPLWFVLLGKGASSNIFAVESTLALRSMTNTTKGFCLLSLAIFGFLGSSSAQTGSNGTTERLKTIVTAVPFLTITPDARAGGMGDAGVATDPDANAAFWNPGKLAFNTQKFGMAVNYTPWLRNIGVTDIFLSHISGFYKFRKEDALAVSLTYFNLGSIQFTDEQNNPITDYNPQEYNIAATYSRLLGRNFSLGITAKFVNSNLFGSIQTSSSGTAINGKPARTAAVDIGGYYTKQLSVNGSPSQLNLGATITNFGPKISYSDNNTRDVLPTNLRLGGAFTNELDEFNKVTIALDISKLLVPSPDSNSGEKALIPGMFGSFNVAPDGSKEELQEIGISGGVEYWYNNLFAVRGGYFYEHPDKGNRRYFTAGIGVRISTLGFDLGYIMPGSDSNSPLSNTLRFSLIFNFNAANSGSSPDAIPASDGPSPAPGNLD
jgi:hypothetical protein